MAYERLTKRICREALIEDEFGNDISTFYKPLGDAVDRLAELEDKIEQGTLIELPCKVGDAVFVIKNYGFNRYVIERVIIAGFNIIPIENNRVYPVDNYGGVYSEIFLTREEAEKRLKELQG